MNATKLITPLLLLGAFLLLSGDPALAQSRSRGKIVRLDLSGVKQVRPAFPDETFAPRAFKTDARTTGWIVRVPAGERSDGDERFMLMPVPSATVAGGLVFVGGGFNSRELNALDAKTGRRIWTAALDDNGPSPPAVTPRRVVVNTESCTTTTLDPVTGSVTWSRRLGPSVRGTPTIFGEHVLAAARTDSNDYALFSMKLDDGEVLWETPLERDLVGAPVVMKDRIYMTLETREVACVSTRGKLLWKKDVCATSAPWVEAGALYVASCARSPAQVVRVDPRDGEVIWTAEVPVEKEAARTRIATTETLARFPLVDPWGWGDDPSRPVVIGRSLFFASGRELAVFDAKIGKLRVRYSLPRGRKFYSPPAILGDRLLYATLNGLLLEIEPVTGTVRRGLDLGVRVTSQPVVAKGRVHVTAWDLVYGIPWKTAGKSEWPEWGGGPSRTGR